MKYKIKMTNTRNGRDAWVGPITGLMTNSNEDAWTFEDKDARAYVKKLEEKIIDGYSISIWLA